MISAKESSLTGGHLHLPALHYRVVITIVVVLILDVKMTHQIKAAIVSFIVNSSRGFPVLTFGNRRECGCTRAGVQRHLGSVDEGNHSRWAITQSELTEGFHCPMQLHKNGVR